MTDGAIFQSLYESHIQFDVCCFSNGGFRIRLGAPATGFTAAVVVDTYADVVQQLRVMALLKLPDSTLAQDPASFGQSPARVAEVIASSDLQGKPPDKPERNGINKTPHRRALSCARQVV